MDLSRSASDGWAVADGAEGPDAISVSIDLDSSSGRTVEKGAVAVERQLSKALVQWKDAHDVRVLRRELLASLFE